MKLIELTKGKFAKVDDEDFERASAIYWHAAEQKHRGENVVYGQSCIGKGSSRRTLMMHRFILKLNPGDPRCDHRNGDGLDNQKTNLRLCTHAQNQWNRRSAKGIELKGVRLMPCGLYRATFHQKSLGLFATKIEAALAYNEAAKSVYGEFAYLNPLTK